MKGLKKNGWTITATIFLAAIVAIEVVKQLNYKVLLILFGFFVVWCIIVFTQLAAFFDNREISFLGFKISSKQDNATNEKQTIEKTSKEAKDKIEKINRQLAELKKDEVSLQEQIKTINKNISNLNKEMSERPKLTVQRVPTVELLKSFYFTNDLEKFNKIRRPINVEDFHNTIEEGKKNDESFKENYYYQSIVDKYSEAFAYALIQKVSPICDTDTLRKIEPTLYGAVKRPYSKATILAIRDELIKDGNKAELTLAFEQFIKELDMLY